MAAVVQTVPLSTRLRRMQLWRSLKFLVLRKPLGAAGLFILVLLVLVAIFAPIIAPFDPLRIHYDSPRVAPDRTFLMGTDQLGRDVFSRVIHASRVSLGIGLSAALVAGAIGAVLGACSGYFGGWFDLWLQRIMDILMGFPLLIMAMAVVAAIGPSTTNVVIAIIVPFFPRVARVVRSSAMSIKEMAYVDAARAMGGSGLRIVLRHVLPNTFAPFIIILSAQMGEAIILESSLSFLGLGTHEPNPSWGAMLAGEVARYARAAPWLAIYPGIALTMAVFSFNIFGDALRDILDPRMRGR